MDLHKFSREKLIDEMAAKGITTGLVLLQGGEDSNQYETDIELVFRQDSWFNYLFGVKEPGMYGAISLSTKQCVLFIPNFPKEYLVIMGKIHPPSDFKASYAVDEVFYTEDLEGWLTKELGTDDKIYLMNGRNTDSGLRAKPATWKNDIVFEDKKDTSFLFDVLSYCRVTKCPKEVDVMRYVAFVASNAHVEVMRSVKDCEFEYELEAKFCYEIYKRGGCRKFAYTNICGCGPNSATLHYGHAGAPNDRKIEPTDMGLLDMGADYHGYVSDITCSYPVSGKFTEDQRIIYEGVLAAQNTVTQHMVPGFTWPACHRLAEKEILVALVTAGVLVLPGSTTIEELQATGIGKTFFPHGLGHLIGCDTHDVGGYLEGTPVKPENIQVNLRTSRVLEAGMILTNEPGCYFIDGPLDDALANPAWTQFIDPEVLKRFRGFGGVRLEDVIMVTDSGAENLTTCPRTVEEVESVMNGGIWPPEYDKAPYLRRRWTKLAPNGEGMVDERLWNVFNFKFSK